MRGAPAIAIAGALALAVELQNGGAGKQFSAAQDAQKHIQESLDYLVTRCVLHTAVCQSLEWIYLFKEE